MIDMVVVAASVVFDVVVTLVFVVLVCGTVVEIVVVELVFVIDVVVFIGVEKVSVSDCCMGM